MSRPQRIAGRVPPIVGGVGDDGGVTLPVGGRFTVATLLASVERDHVAGRSVVAGQPLADLLGWFRGECAAVVADCPPEAVPLRLPKARIADLLACERGTLARLGHAGLAEPIVRGRLTDLVVAQHVTVGLGQDGAERRADLLDGLAAAGDGEVVAWLDGAGEEVRDRLWHHVDVAAAGLRDTWGVVPRRWWPRTQERVAVEVADGALLLGAQFDLALGGPPTDLPAVIVEVKAGAATDRHRRDLLWYGLVSALRHDRAPAVVATWTAADGGLVPVPVTIGALEAAARRGLAALERLVGLAAGREPEVRPNAGCPWCPELDRCPPGLASVASRSPVDEAEWDPAALDLVPWE